MYVTRTIPNHFVFSFDRISDQFRPTSVNSLRNFMLGFLFILFNEPWHCPSRRTILLWPTAKESAGLFLSHSLILSLTSSHIDNYKSLVALSFLRTHTTYLSFVLSTRKTISIYPPFPPLLDTCFCSAFQFFSAYSFEICVNFRFSNTYLYYKLSTEGFSGIRRYLLCFWF